MVYFLAKEGKSVKYWVFTSAILKQDWLRVGKARLYSCSFFKNNLFITTGRLMSLIPSKA